jgi:predicted enzyme related to lactoylglutathione lyase
VTKPAPFKIIARDPARAAWFYRTVFGWETAKRKGGGGYRLVRPGRGGSPPRRGLITRRSGERLPDLDSIGEVCPIVVDDIDAAVDLARSAGARIVRGKAIVPGVGYVAYGKDPEGNTFGLCQPVAGAGSERGKTPFALRGH